MWKLLMANIDTDYKLDAPVESSATFAKLLQEWSPEVEVDGGSSLPVAAQFNIWNRNVPTIANVSSQ